MFIIISTLNTALKEVNNVRDHFSSDTAPSKYEFSVAREFFNELGKPFHIIVAMKATDGGSLLRPMHIKKALEIEEFLQYKLQITYEERNYSYSDFCGSQCETSDVVNTFLKLYYNAQQEIRQNNFSDSVKLTFPTIDVYGHPIYLANNIFQVQLNNRSKQVESAKLIVINFHAVYPNATAEAIMRKWEKAVLKFAVNSLNDELVHVYVTSEGLMSEEVRRTGKKAVPLVSVTIFVILAFTVLTSLKFDPIKSKPWEAAIGVLCPLFAVCASFGLLFWLGFDFLPILIVVPFLIIAVGVDDIFIFLHCWSRSDALNLPVRNRIALVLAESGPSITITSLTNFLSFSIGILTPTPAIRIFCIYTSVAVLFDYIYQIVFYTAIFKLFGEREKKCLNAYFPWIKMNNKQLQTSKNFYGKWLQSSELFSIFFDAIVNFFKSWWARFFLVLTLTIYWICAWHGFAQLHVGMSSEKLFLSDSPLLELVYLQREIIFKEGGQMIVFVNNPGNLKLSNRVKSITHLLNLFENAPGSVGAGSTQIWLNHYLSFISLQENSFNFTYKYMPQFMNSSEFYRWTHYVNMGKANECYKEKETCVKKFLFTTGFHNAISWSDRLLLLHSWRKIAAQFPDLNVTIFDHFSVYPDQLESIPQATLQTVFFALVCMSIVLTVFTPHYSTILPSVLCVLSINFGVFGFLHYCAIDLDPISLTTTLMAIGLSVDYVAHISFHYYQGEFESQQERLKHTLASIAWPMIQAACSTTLSLAVLATITAYMVQVFVKVVFLVVGLGLFHGLFVLPIIFLWMPFKKRVTLPSTKFENIKSFVIGDSSLDLNIKTSPYFTDPNYTEKIFYSTNRRQR